MNSWHTSNMGQESGRGYLIGSAGVDNIKSQHVLEWCGFHLVGKRTLMVHVTNGRYDFKHYWITKSDKL